jgi:putative membrane protein
MLMAFLLWSGDGWAAGPHVFWLGPLWGPLSVGLIVGGIWLVFRNGPDAPWAGRRSGAERAAEVLAERYARGEISTDEYRERLAHLRGSGA